MAYANDNDQVDAFVRQRRQEMVENKQELMGAIKIYTGSTKLLSEGGLLPRMSPIIDAGNSYIAPTNISVDKVAEYIEASDLCDLYDVNDPNTTMVDDETFAAILRTMDFGYMYADADKYYKAASLEDQPELLTPADGVVIKADSMAVYKDGEKEMAIIHTEDDEFYIRQVTDEDYANMREVTYDEFNPWHRDVSQMIQDNGEDYTSIEDLKTESVERQKNGGEPGKSDVEPVEVGDTDAYDKNSSDSSNREKYMQRIQDQVDSIAARQAVEDSVEAKKEQDQLNRMFYGRKASKYM